MLACNGYLDALDPGCGKRVMPINNFILATEPLGEDACAGADRLATSPSSIPASW